MVIHKFLPHCSFCAINPLSWTKLPEKIVGQILKISTMHLFSYHWHQFCDVTGKSCASHDSINFKKLNKLTKYTIKNEFRLSALVDSFCCLDKQSDQFFSDFSESLNVYRVFKVEGILLIRIKDKAHVFGDVIFGEFM